MMTGLTTGLRSEVLAHAEARPTSGIRPVRGRPEALRALLPTPLWLRAHSRGRADARAQCRGQADSVAVQEGSVGQHNFTTATRWRRPPPSGVRDPRRRT